MGSSSALRCVWSCEVLAIPSSPMTSRAGRSRSRSRRTIASIATRASDLVLDCNFVENLQEVIEGHIGGEDPLPPARSDE